MDTDTRKQIARDLSRRPPADVHFIQWQLRDDGLRVIFPLLGIVSVVVAATVVSSSVLMGLLAGTAVAAALWRYWVPIEVRLSARGMEQTCFGRRRRILWSDIGAFQFQPRGVAFTATHRGVLTAALDGAFVRFGNRREAVREIIQYYTFSSVNTVDVIETTITYNEEEPNGSS